MNRLDHAQLRVEAFLREIERLSEIEFPYWHSQAALEQLKVLFEAKLARLRSFAPTSSPDVVAQECRVTLHAIVDFLPILGFVLRSTNVRNAFEVFGPFLRLAGQILEPSVDSKNRTTRLLLSSEWRYSPFIYKPIVDLKDFLLIGVPAPESANPMLLPLAGHELGHSVWTRFALHKAVFLKAEDEIEKAIQDTWPEYEKHNGSGIDKTKLRTVLSLRNTWRQALQWTLRQAEESFCDFLGLRIFGESYLHAFGYLLSPGFGGRPAWYPDIRARCNNLVTAATKYAFSAPKDFTAVFEDDILPTLSAADLYQLKIADVALKSLIPTLIDAANKVFKDSGVASGSTTERDRVLQRIRLIVPAENCKTVADILNGAWLALEDQDLWKEHPEINARRGLVLKELILKNLELFEIERIQAG